MEILVAVAWPYVNGDLHLGHIAGAILPADIFARFNRQIGNDVLMVSGSDFHGTPTIIAAEKLGISPEKFAKKYHKRHLETLNNLGVIYNLYTTTDTDNHKDIVQRLFLDLYKKGYIVKKKTRHYWSEKEKKYLLDRYIEGECPYCHYDGARGDQCDKCGRVLDPTELINPKSKYGDKNLILKEGEDCFLDLPALQKDLIKWLDKHPNVRNWRDNVIKFTSAWLDEGLKQRPITRDLEYGIKLPKGIDIENKEEKVIYVWVEAVTGYWSAAVEWSKRVSGAIKGGENDIIINRYSGQKKSWRDFWLNKSCRHYYFMGKDNIVFHTIIWPSILIGWNKDKEEKMQLAYDVPANAFLNLEGDKMSKSRHWFVDLEYLIKTYGQDLVRYYFTLRMPENKDSNFKWKDFIDSNNNILVANLGNFIHRILSFVNSKFGGKIPEGEITNEVRFEIRDAFNETEQLLEKVKLSEGLQRVFRLVSFANKYFDREKVWKIVEKDKKKSGDILYNCIQIIEALRVLLAPFLPNATKKLTKMLKREDIEWKVDEDNWRFSEVKAGTVLDKVEVLFKKLDTEIAEKEKLKLGKKINI